MFNNKKIAIINHCIANGIDVPDLIEKSDQFYKYLLDNNIAYYYSKILSKNHTQVEKKIIDKGEYYNDKYYKTLKFISDACAKHSIEFLLFKTFKYIPEVVDGDIDIIVHANDFYRFLKVFEKLGFESLEDEILKGVCEKDGFCKIEPRVNISFHDMIFVPEKNIWENTEKIVVNNISIRKTTKELDLISLILNILYGPNYLKLYLCTVLRDVNSEEILKISFNSNFKKDLELILNKIAKDKFLDSSFPYFLNNFLLIKFYIKKILFRKDLKFSEKIRYVVFFFYFKYKYLLTGKLHFKHKWI